MMRRAAIVLVGLVLAAGCAGDGKYAELKAPKSVKLDSTPRSTVPQNLDEIQLPGVDGTTTTVPVRIGPGSATIVGRVDGPDGPVAGATVQLERLVGDKVATLRVPTAADGTWNARGVLGGRYRIRAWQSPGFAMAQADLVFIDATKTNSVDLHVDRFTGVIIDGAIAPSPPVVGQPTTLGVRVLTRQVDGQGVVRDVPALSTAVTLAGSGAWSTTSPNPGSTGTSGTATFIVKCLASGTQPISAQLPDGTVQPLSLPACSPAPSATSSTTSTTKKP